MEKVNSSERAKAIIKAFEQLSVEEMEKLLIKLGIPTNKKLQNHKKLCKKMKKITKLLYRRV